MEGLMKSKKGIKKLLMALALVLCVAAFVPATASVQAEAKTKKVTANEKLQKSTGAEAWNNLQGKFQK